MRRRLSSAPCRGSLDAGERDVLIVCGQTRGASAARILRSDIERYGRGRWRVAIGSSEEDKIVDEVCRRTTSCTAHRAASSLTPRVLTLIQPRALSR